MMYADQTASIDIAALELEARKLRAETIAKGLGNLKRWAGQPFGRVARSI